MGVRNKLAKNIEHLRGLEKNWDGYWGESITERSIEDSLLVCEVLAPLICLPTLRPTRSGGVELDFYNENLVIEIGPGD